MPAWPLGTTYTKGLLGHRPAHDGRGVAQAGGARARGLDASGSRRRAIAEIQTDPQLMTIVRQTGRTLFGDNCAACHGRRRQGRQGLSQPHDGVVAVGRHAGGDRRDHPRRHQFGASEHAASRRCSAFGRDGMLQRADIDNVVAYVQSSSDPAARSRCRRRSWRPARRCSPPTAPSCHGDDGKGKTEVGAPDLTDKFWIYGGDAQSIYATVWGGRQGHMPTWEERLPLIERKILALYLVDLRAKTP